MPGYRDKTFSLNLIPFFKKTQEFPSWLSGLRTQLVFMKTGVQSLASIGGLRIQCCRGCSVGQQLTAFPIRSLAWELPYAMGATLKSKKKKSKNKQTKKVVRENTKGWPPWLRSVQFCGFPHLPEMWQMVEVTSLPGPFSFPSLLIPSQGDHSINQAHVPASLSQAVLLEHLT